MLVVINKEGKVAGSFRADPIETGSGTVQARLPSQSSSTMRRGADRFSYHELDAPESLLEKSAEELHEGLRQQLRASGIDVSD